MNDKINDGGQAFPTSDIVVNKQGDVQHVAVTGGMSLRDYFASEATDSDIWYYLEEPYTPENRAKAKYKFADAMIKARDKKTT